MNSWQLSEGDEIQPGRHVVRLLGGGHRYEAFLAWDDALHALVVVKVLRPRLAGDRHALGGLTGEAEALQRLQHPMLVRGFGAVLGGARPHLVLEFLEGPRLSTLVRRFGVGLEQLLPLTVNVCSVLHYLGAQGWMHLDVKPRNLIMGSSPRLIDLSVARRVGDIGTLVSGVGTAGYMAPEQRDPMLFGQLGPAADIWGLGATVYEALTGALPGDEPEPLPDHVPAAVRDAVHACFAPRPQDRPTAAELAAELEPVAAALPPPRLGPMRPGGKRRMRDLELR